MPKTKAEIIERLNRERATLVERYRALTPDELVAPCTESEAPDGTPWSAKDHLAHLLRIEEAFLAMAKRTLGGEVAPVRFSGTSREEAIAGVHRDNERHVSSLRDRSLDDLLGDLDVARQATLAFLADATDEHLATPIPGAPWGDGTIGGVLLTNAYHERGHLAWVDEGLASLGG